MISSFSSNQVELYHLFLNSPDNVENAEEAEED